MNRKIKMIANGLLAMMVALLLVTCSSHLQPIRANEMNRGTQSFRSNGERIYFTSTSDQGTNITSTGVPSSGVMNGNSSGGMMGNGTSGGMMNGGSSGGMVGNGNLTCASCHGADGRGGVHTMMGMQTMNAPDIRWSALKSEFDAEKFRLAVTKGQDPDGEKQLNNSMPRWNIGNDDLTDLITYLKTLP
jgi:hypothetical protein